jgi:hypothetical protein
MDWYPSSPIKTTGLRFVDVQNPMASHTENEEASEVS